MEYFPPCELVTHVV